MYSRSAAFVVSLFCILLIIPEESFSQRRRGKDNDFISELRPTYWVERKNGGEKHPENSEELTFPNALNDTLDYYLDSMNTIYFTNGVGIRAHSVLGYNGKDQKKALEIRRQVLGMFPNAPVNNIWEPPNRKVKIGPFSEKLTAIRIKEKLLEGGAQNVLIIPDAIYFQHGKQVRN